MRHAATRALFERRDVVIVASVSCIYGIGSPETYATMTVEVKSGQEVSRADLLKKLVELQYKRNDTAFQRGTFRVRGDTIDIFPAHYEDRAWRLTLFGDEVEAIHEFDPLTGDKRSEEHTSELQSLMRRPYAVFCLKKKNKRIINEITCIPPKTNTNEVTIPKTNNTN